MSKPQRWLSSQRSLADAVADPGSVRGLLRGYVAAGARMRRVPGAIQLCGPDRRSVVVIEEPEETLVGIVEALFAGRPGAWAELMQELGAEAAALVSSLGRAGIVGFAAVIGGVTWAYVERPSRDPTEILLDRPLVLSRYAYQRASGARMVVETALSHSVLVVEEPRVAAAFAALHRPCTQDELEGRACLGSAEEAQILLAIFFVAGIADAQSESDRCALDEECGDQLWEFHDLLSHHRSRHFPAYPWSVIHPAPERRYPPPVLEPPRAAPLRTIALAPTSEAAISRRPDFFRVLRSRVSRRAHAATPMALDSLAALLREALRIRRTMEHPTLGPGVRRPYPSGGGRGELTAYVAARSVDALEPGLYRYDAKKHALEFVSPMTAGLRRTFDVAQGAMAEESSVHAVILLAAGYARVAWKYSSIAYSLILRNTGSAIGTLSLVAEALGLAACPLGYSCDDATLSALTGVPVAEECIVGEVAVGAPAEPFASHPSSPVEQEECVGVERGEPDAP